MVRRLDGKDARPFLDLITSYLARCVEVKNAFFEVFWLKNSETLRVARVMRAVLHRPGL
jgi:hypothetical protein